MKCKTFFSLLVMIPVMAFAIPELEGTAVKNSGISLKNQDAGTIRGTIMDEKGEPLIGVSVQIEGTGIGTMSDINGYYVIEAKAGDVIKFSYVGFKDFSYKVKEKDKSFNAVLKEDLSELEEFVVVGMGQQRKASVIGSISSVSVNELNMPNRSLTASLSGRVAGAVAVQRSGEPGQDVADFWIRGISTFGSNTKPLMLVDGVERDISDIPVEEIASVSILKDASATAVYGVRAANGVVIVTTRKGVAQKPAVELKLEYGMNDLPRMPKFLAGADYAVLYNEALGEKHFTDEYIEKLTNRTGMYDKYLYPNVNWFDETFNKYSSNMNASLSVTGGSELVRYFVTAGYFGDDGNLKNWAANDYESNVTFKRYNFRSNIDLSITKTTTVNLELAASLIDMNQPGIGNRSIYGVDHTPAEEVFYWSYLATPLATAVRVPIGVDSNGYGIMGWGAPSQVGEKNPAERLFSSGYTRDFRTQTLSQFVLNQDLPFILKGLSFKGSFAFDYYNKTTQNYKGAASTYNVSGLDPVTNGLLVKAIDTNPENLTYSKESYSNRSIEFKTQLNYDNLFDRVHRVGGMVLYYQREYIDSSAGTSILSLPYREQGVSFRATYSYADRYFAEFNAGYNGSENFPKNDRFGFFPAGAIGYLITNEPFWNLDWITVLKFKASVGLVGNQDLSGGRFGYLSQYSTGLGSYNFGEVHSYSNEIAGIGESQIGAKNLTWEKGLKQNLGLELMMFDNKISFDLDFFRERRTDILTARKTIPGYGGFGNMTIYANIGEVENKGFDSSLDLNHKFGELEVRLNGNFTFASNEILKMDEAQRKYAYTMKTGHRYNQQFGLIALGLFKDQDDIDSSPSQSELGQVRKGDVKYLDYNGDGVVNRDDMVAIGYSNIPEIAYGFGTQFTWRNFDLGIFFRGQDRVSYALGGSTYIPFYEGVGKGNVFVEALDRWTEDSPNPNAFYPRLSNGVSANNAQESTRNIYNGRLLRLSDLELGYTFNHSFVQKIGLSNLRVYFLGNNVALFSKWEMWDPETGSRNGHKYPNSRKFNIGLKAKF